MIKIRGRIIKKWWIFGLLSMLIIAAAFALQSYNSPFSLRKAVETKFSVQAVDTTLGEECGDLTLSTEPFLGPEFPADSCDTCRDACAAVVGFNHPNLWLRTIKPRYKSAAYNHLHNRRRLRQF